MDPSSCRLDLEREVPMGRVRQRVSPAIVLLPMATALLLYTALMVVSAALVSIPLRAAEPETTAAASPLPVAKEFIKGGTARGVYIPHGGWAPKGDVFVGQGRNNIALADHTIGMGNFDIEVKLALHKVGANYAGIQFGNGRLILGGDGGNLIFQGYPKKDHRVVIGPLSEHIEKDTPVTIRIRRRGGTLLMFVKGKRVHAEQGIGGEIGEFGIIAGDGPVDVHLFRATGNLTSTGRRQRINERRARRR
ncbi:MAG: hypothetical protein COB10_10280 [Planctomycetota bacterium]|nr:MAG: hypothetical protein COB10_10280 [Planctomycetota bacterium]